MEESGAFLWKNDPIQAKKQLKWDPMDAHVCVANGS